MPMDRGNTPCSKQFLKQLIKSGTRMPIESILRLFNEKLIIIMELFIICVICSVNDRNCVVLAVCAEGGFLYAYRSTFIHEFLNLVLKAELC